MNREYKVNDVVQKTSSLPLLLLSLPCCLGLPQRWTQCQDRVAEGGGSIEEMWGHAVSQIEGNWFSG